MVSSAKELLTMKESELEDLFANAEAGPIPNGQADGTAIFAPDTVYDSTLAEVVKIFAWQGKVFNAEKMLLVNRILVFGIDAIIAQIKREPSWIDGKECIVLDYSQTSFVAHWIRDEIRLIGPKLYLGRVFWDKTKLIFFALQF